MRPLESSWRTYVTRGGRLIRPLVITAAMMSFIGVTYFLGSSDSFGECFEGHKHDRRYAGIYDRSKTTLSRDVSRIDLGIMCSYYAIDKRSGGLTATFTLVLALTSMLQWSAIKRQADALDKTILRMRQAEEIGKAQVRAYLSIIEPTVVIYQPNSPSMVNWPYFKFKIVNSGNSPAINVATRIQAIILPPNGPISIKGISRFGKTVRGVSISNDRPEAVEVFATGVDISEKDIEAFRAGNLHLVVSIYLTFSDVFKETFTQRHDLSVRFQNNSFGVAAELLPCSISPEEIVKKGAYEAPT